MYYTAYKITNINTNKIYIGVHRTENLNDNYMGSGKYLVSAIKKHGKNSFRKTILRIFDNEKEMLDYERSVVTKDFCLREDTYNIRAGADGYENSGFEYINKNKLNNKNQNFQKAISRHKYLLENDKEYYDNWYNKIKMSCAWKGTFKGRKHSEEALQKMRKSKNVGSSNPQYGTMWITDGVKNKKLKRVDNIPEGWYKGRTGNK